MTLTTRGLSSAGPTVDIKTPGGPKWDGRAKEASQAAPWHYVLLLIAVGAWINYAEHPTAKNLKRAVLDTLEL